MDFEVRRSHGTAIVTAAGDLDMEVADLLRDRLAGIIATDPDRIIVDLSAVSFVDSTILGVLAGARNRLAPNSDRLQLVINHPAVLRLFHITRLDQVLTIHPTLDEALPPG